MVQKLEELGKRQRAKPEVDSAESRTIGRAIAKVKSSPGGKNWISEMKVTGLLSSMHAVHSGMDEARVAREKEDEGIKAVNASLKADREPEDVGRTRDARGVRGMGRMGDKMPDKSWGGDQGHEEVLEMLKKSNDGLVRAYRNLNQGHNRLVDLVAGESLEATKQASRHLGSSPAAQQTPPPPLDPGRTAEKGEQHPSWGPKRRGQTT